MLENFGLEHFQLKFQDNKKIIFWTKSVEERFHHNF